MSTSITNRTTLAGQTLILQSGPIPAVLSLQQLSPDVSTDPAGQASYALHFRLTGYGLAWPASWTTYSPGALQAASQRHAGRMQHVQVRFTHQGAAHELRVLGFALQGQAVPQAEPARQSQLGSHYLAAGVYGTHEHENLALALLAKLYRPGILPEFIVRGEGEGPAPEAIDEDFLDLWMASCRFFALVILHSRRLGNLPHDPQLLQAFLLQRGFYLRPEASGLDVGSLRELLVGQAQAAGERGTAAVFADQGEFSRLINRSAYAPKPALQVAFTPADRRGWVLGLTGPGFAGTAGQPATVLRYQQRALATAIRLLLPIANQATVVPSSTAIDRGTDLSRNGLLLRPTADMPAQLGGLGRLPAEARLYAHGGAGQSAGIPIDAGIDYEILWLVRQADPLAITRLTCHLYNAHGYPALGLDHDSGQPTTLVVEGPFSAEFTWVRTILWNCRQAPATGPRQRHTNLGHGHQLRSTASAQLVEPGAYAELPVLGELAPGGGEESYQRPALFIADIQVRPLVHGATLYPQAPTAAQIRSGSSLPFDSTTGARSQGFLGAGPTLEVWYRNQNPDLAHEDIYRIARRDLTPADCHLDLHPAQ